jgi:hypothetical protein
VTVTSPLVSFGLFALTIKQDAELTYSRSMQPFSKLNDLLTDNITVRPYITYEPDYWLLDGGFKIMPTDNALVHTGITSFDMSQADGSFVTAGVLEATFSIVHTTDGLTLRGNQHSQDWADEVTISFYDSGDLLICTDTYYPTTWAFSTGKAVEDFKRITITFVSTNKPNRYLRMQGIDFGTLTYFTAEDIQRGSVFEEIDPVSLQITSNTCELELFSQDAEFSIVNPEGDYAALQQNQPLDIYESVDGVSNYIGRFYLDVWDNTAENVITFQCVDLISIIGEIPYLGGFWPDGVTVLTVLEHVLGNNDIPYNIDPTLSNILVRGWLQPGTIRDALQQIAFALGAYISCARSNQIQIYPTIIASDLSSFSNEITNAEKSISSKLTLRKIVTGVEVTGHEYVEITDVETLWDGVLAVGAHLITFPELMHDLTKTVGDAVISSSGSNWMILTVSTEEQITVTGQKYIDTKKIYSVYNTGLDASVKPNILEIGEATLVNALNGQTAAQRVYDYYQQRYVDSFKLFAPSAYVGQSALVVALYDQQLGAVIEKMDLDLTGGFAAQTTVTGVIQ